MHTRPGRGGKPAARCEVCAKNYASKQKDRRERLKAEGLERGLCVNCGSDRDRPEVQLCEHCRQLNSKNCIRYQRRRSLAKRRRKARKRALANRTAQARAEAREVADTLLRRLSLAPAINRTVQ